MKKIEIEKTAIECMIVISCIMTVFANVISFYFTGNGNDLVRKIVSQGFICVIALFLLLYVVRKFFMSGAEIRRNIILCALPLAVNMIICLAAVVKSAGRADMLRNLLSCGAYSMPLVCGAIYIMTEDKFDSVVRRTKYVAAIIIPYWLAALKCFWGLNFYTDSLANFGQIGYLNIGYSAVIIYSILLCDLGKCFYGKNVNRVAGG